MFGISSRAFGRWHNFFIKNSSQVAPRAFILKMDFSTQYQGIFPPMPRFNGVAKCTSGAETPVKETAASVVKFVTKSNFQTLAAALPGGVSALQDAEKENFFISYTSSGDRVLTYSVNCSDTEVTACILRKSASDAVLKLRTLKASACTVELPNFIGAPSNRVADTIAQAFLLTNYQFNRYLSTKDVLLDNVHFSHEGTADVDSAVKTAITLAECTIMARDLNNERADEMHPGRVEQVAEQVKAETGADLYVLRGTDLVKEGLHLLHAVGQASQFPPRYIELYYKGDPENPEDKIMIVGKGITYDTGGLNIKGTGFMEDMHMDKGGASAVLGSLTAAHRLGVKRNIVAIVTCAENAIGSMAYKPHSILKSHKGLTVMVGNTDAEGRLALADALSYGQQRHNPHTIIDLATLTGACVVALGEYAAGLFSNNATLNAKLQAAGDERFERLWPMPVFPEHREEIKTGAPEADLKSTGGGKGGSCTAAAFLENFIGPVQRNGESVTPAWAHLDIAGPAMYKSRRGFMPQNGTGFGVQAITQYLLAAPKGALPPDTPKRF